MAMQSNKNVFAFVIFFTITLLNVSEAFSLVKILSPIIESSSLIEIRPANLPKDLEGIKECRRCAFDAKRTSLRASERSFMEAVAASTKTNVVCLVAKEKLFPWRVLGTADVKVNEQSGDFFINNVFVRPEARGQGLGKKMMMGAEEFVATGETVSLEVYTQNKVAYNLYRRIGYKTPGIHRVVSALSESTGLNLQVKMVKEFS